MKRDMDLIRAILMKAEGMDERMLRDTWFTVDGYDEELVAKHLELMQEQDLIAANILTLKERGAIRGKLERITWDGHDLLASLQNQSV